MLKRLARATSHFMQALIPAGPMMYSSADMPSTAPWADYWYQSMQLPGMTNLVGGDEAYEYISSCFAATRLLCGVGSKMPINRIHKVDTPDGETSSVMRNDPVHRLMNFQANPDQTSMSFRSMMVSWQVNRGTAFANIQRETLSNKPIALWPIHPTRCKYFRSETDGSLWWHVKNNRGIDTDIPDTNMLRVPYTVLDRSGLLGVGVSQRSMGTVQIGQSLDRTENDASMSGVPRIVVEAERQMSLPEQDGFRRQWRELYTQGGEGVALLVGKMTAKPLSWSAVDQDFVRRREFNIEDVARWYDVPLTLLRRAVAESAGNVEQLGQEFQMYSLAFLEIWEQELGRKMLTEADLDDGQSFELDYKSLLRADHTGRAQYHSAMVPIGAESPNEVRAAEGRNPYPDGKKFYVQGALRPTDEPYNSTSPQDSPIDPKIGKADPLKAPKPFAKLEALLSELLCGGAGGEHGPCPTGRAKHKHKKKHAGHRAKPQVPSVKAARAKAAHHMVDSKIQRYSEEHNEPRLAKKLGGKSEPDNKEYDVLLSGNAGKPAHGIELKTMVSNKSNKLTMKGSAQDRKAQWEVEHKATFHTVVYDDQKVFNAKGDGVHGSEANRAIYYRRGAGSFRVDGMYKVKDHAELKSLIQMHENALPKEAQSTPQWKARQGAAKGGK